MLKFIKEYKTFFIAFFLSLLVFGSMFLATLYFVMTKQDKVSLVNKNEEGIPITDNYIPSLEDNLSIVLMCGADKKTTPTTYFLMHFSAVTNQCIVVEIPRYTRCTSGNATKTLDGFYSYSGMNGAAAAVSSLFSLKSSEYIRLDSIGVKNFVDYFSGVSYNFKEPISADSYSFKAGEQLLDGARFSELIIENTFEEKSALLSEFLGEHLNYELSTSLNSLYEILFEQSNTSLNRASLMKYELPAKRFLQSNFEKVSSQLLTGIMRDGAFVPEYDKIMELKKSFSQTEDKS